MNKKQKIALLITAVVWLWIAFGGPYDSITYTGHRGFIVKDDEDDEYHKELEQFKKLQKLALEPVDRVKVVEAFKRVKALRKSAFSEPEQWTVTYYCFQRAGRPYFPEILRAWIAVMIPAGITIYLLKTHK